MVLQLKGQCIRLKNNAQSQSEAKLRSTNVKAKPERSAPRRTIDEATETFKVSKAKFKISEPLVISRGLNALSIERSC